METKSMDKKIGNIVYFFLFLTINCFGFTDKSVRLSVQDAQHNSVKEIEQGLPFIVQVHVENFENISQVENVPGFEKFQVQSIGSSQMVSVVNGLQTKSVIFTFILTGTKKGDYRFGPLVLEDSNGEKIASGQVNLKVGQTTEYHKSAQQKFILKTMLDKYKVYVGQKVIMTLRFYYSEGFDNVQISEPILENIQRRAVSKHPNEGKEIINGTEYHFKEWLLDLYPEKAGKFIIPPYQASFTIKNKKQLGFGGIFDFFGSSVEQSIKSSSQTLQIDALPEGKENFDGNAVGHFQSIVFELQKNKGEIGEGIVGKMKIVGDGNFDMMAVPLLKLPEGLRYYESNSFLEDKDDKIIAKTFEFIIQADGSGKFEIPAQKFMYFDPVVEKYKSITSNKIMLEIHGEVLQKKVDMKLENNEQKMQNKHNDNQAFKFSDDQIQDINYNAYDAHEHSKPFWQNLLAWALFLCLVIVAGFFIYKLWNNYSKFFMYNSLFMQSIMMKIDLYHVQKNEDINGLYKIFEKISLQYNFDLHSEDFQNLLKKKYGKITPQIGQQWKAFRLELEEVRFSGSFVKREKMIALLKLAPYWIKTLHVCLNGFYKKQTLQTRQNQLTYKE